MELVFLILFLVIEIVALALIFIIPKIKKDKFSVSLVYPLLFILSFIFIIRYLTMYEMINNNYADVLLSALTGTLDIIKLTKNNLLTGIENYNLLYGIDFLGLYIISFSIVFNLAVNLFLIGVKNLFSGKVFFKEKIFVFGFTEESKLFLTDLKKNKTPILVLNKRPKYNYEEEKMFCNQMRIKYIICRYNDYDSFKKCIKRITKNNIFNKIQKLICIKIKRERIDVKFKIVTFFDDDETNLNLIKYEKRYIKENELYGNIALDNIQKGLYNNQLFVVKTKKYSNEDTNKEYTNEVLYGDNKPLAIYAVKDDLKKDCYYHLFKANKNKSNIVIKMNKIEVNKIKEPFYSYVDKLDKRKVELDINDELNHSIKDKDAFIRVVNVKYQKRIEFIHCTSCEQSMFLNDLINHGDNDDKSSEINYKMNIEKITSSSRGLIKVFNKYDALALDFIENHNFAKYLDEDDKCNSVLNEDGTLSDCNINLFIFGFGKVNKALLRDILIQNQFIKNENNKLIPIRINTKIYDLEEEFNSLSLSTGLFKYRKSDYIVDVETNKQRDSFYDLPDDYASHVKYIGKYNFGKLELFNNIYNDINKKRKVKTQINFFITSFSTDLENAHFAKKLKDNISSIPNCQNTYFIRSKSGNVFDDSKNVIYFGQDKSIFTYDNIILDSYYRSAKEHHVEYLDLSTNEKCKNTYFSKDEFLDREFSFLSPIKQKSCIYLAKSYVFKNTLFKKNKNAYETLVKLIKKYDKITKNPNEKEYKEFVDRYEKIVENGKNYDLLDIVALCEHERWNAYEFSVGALPWNKNEYISQEGKKNSKTNDEMYHVCITSWKGLVELDKKALEFIIHDYKMPLCQVKKIE